MPRYPAAWCCSFCRVCSQIAPTGVFGANTATFFQKKADFLAVLAVKSTLYAFYVQTRQRGRAAGATGLSAAATETTAGEAATAAERGVAAGAVDVAGLGYGIAE